MVPSGWEKKLFKDLIKLDRGSSPRPIVNFITESDNGVNWIKIGDTNKDSLYINSTKQKITLEGTKKSRRVSKGEIILSNSMSYGKPYILNINGCIHDGWFVIREYEDSFNKSYLIQYLSSELIQNQYKRLAAGGVVSNISSELVYSVKANVPPLPEQHKIAEILTTWDKAIATTERLIDNSRQQKKALMQQLLTGKKRLLDDDGKKFESEWDEVKLRECAISLDNKRVPLNSTERLSMQGDIPYWGANGIQGYIDKYIFDEPIVLLAEDGGNFSEFSKRPIANISYGKAWVNNHAHVLKAKSNTITEWLYYSLVHKNILAFVNGGTRAKLNKGDMLLIPILLPPVKEQQKIAAVLTNADEEIELLEQQLTDLQQEKKSLMQQLLTGKKRVKLD